MFFLLRMMLFLLHNFMTTCCLYALTYPPPTPTNQTKSLPVPPTFLIFWLVIKLSNEGKERSINYVSIICFTNNPKSLPRKTAWLFIHVLSSQEMVLLLLKGFPWTFFFKKIILMNWALHGSREAEHNMKVPLSYGNLKST